MANEPSTLTDGIFTLAESNDPNVFYFYRNDGEVIGDVGRIPIDFYQDWICVTMSNGKMPEKVFDYPCLETSDDGKRIKLTVSGIGERKVQDEKPKLFKVLFSKHFKWALAIHKMWYFYIM